MLRSLMEKKVGSMQAQMSNAIREMETLRKKKHREEMLQI